MIITISARLPLWGWMLLTSALMLFNGTALCQIEINRFELSPPHYVHNLMAGLTHPKTGHRVVVGERSDKDRILRAYAIGYDSSGAVSWELEYGGPRCYRNAKFIGVEAKEEGWRFFGTGDRRVSFFMDVSEAGKVERSVDLDLPFIIRNDQLGNGPSMCTYRGDTLLFFADLRQPYPDFNSREVVAFLPGVGVIGETQLDAVFDGEEPLFVRGANGLPEIWSRGKLYRVEPARLGRGEGKSPAAHFRANQSPRLIVYSATDALPTELYRYTQGDSAVIVSLSEIEDPNPSVINVARITMSPNFQTAVLASDSTLHYVMVDGDWFTGGTMTSVATRSVEPRPQSVVVIDSTWLRYVTQLNYFHANGVPVARFTEVYQNPYGERILDLRTHAYLYGSDSLANYDFRFEASYLDGVICHPNYGIRDRDGAKVILDSLVLLRDAASDQILASFAADSGFYSRPGEIGLDDGGVPVFVVNTLRGWPVNTLYPDSAWTDFSYLDREGNHLGDIRFEELYSFEFPKWVPGGAVIVERVGTYFGGLQVKARYLDSARSWSVDGAQTFPRRKYRTLGYRSDSVYAATVESRTQLGDSIRVTLALGSYSRGYADTSQFHFDIVDFGDSNHISVLDVEALVRDSIDVLLAALTTSYLHGPPIETYDTYYYHLRIPLNGAKLRSVSDISLNPLALQNFAGRVQLVDSERYFFLARAANVGNYNNQLYLYSARDTTLTIVIESDNNQCSWGNPNLYPVGDYWHASAYSAAYGSYPVPVVFELRVAPLPPRIAPPTPEPTIGLTILGNPVQGEVIRFTTDLDSERVLPMLTGMMGQSIPFTLEHVNPAAGLYQLRLHSALRPGPYGLRVGDEAKMLLAR